MNTPSRNPPARADGSSSANRQRTSPPDAHSPAMLPSPARASAAHEPSVKGDKSKENAPKIKMKRTGTNGLPPGHSAPNALGPQYANTVTKLSAPYSVPTSANQENVAVRAAKEKPIEDVSDTTQNGLKPVLGGLEGRPLSRDSSQSATTGASRPASAGGRTAEMAKTASPQSIAMKRENLHLSSQNVYTNYLQGNGHPARWTAWHRRQPKPGD
jgi:hypothetical protein